MRAILVILLLIVGSGCAYNRQYFRPTERVRGQTMQGYHAAFYELVGHRGRFGEAKIWSVGAYRKGEHSVIDVTLDVHNTSDQPIVITAKELLLDPVRTRSDTLQKVPAAETGAFKVGPEQRASLRAHFLLPDGVRPGEVRSFGFRWRVKNGDQSYAQLTPFREEVAYAQPIERDYYYYHSVYPCSPYDLNCVGFYDDWPYQRPLVVPMHEQQPRRRVDVRD
jgi:hypothetical protein